MSSSQLMGEDKVRTLRDEIYNFLQKSEGLRKSFYSLFRNRLVESTPTLGSILSYYPREMGARHEVSYVLGVSFTDSGKVVDARWGGVIVSEAEMLKREGVDAIATTFSIVAWEITSPRQWFEGTLEVDFYLLWGVKLGGEPYPLQIQLHYGIAKLESMIVFKDGRKLNTVALPERIAGKVIFSCRLLPSLQYDVFPSSGENMQLLGEYLHSIFIEKEGIIGWGILCERWLFANMERLSLDTLVGGRDGKEVGWVWFTDPVDEKPRVLISPYSALGNETLSFYHIKTERVDGIDSASFKYTYRAVLPKGEGAWDELFNIEFMVDIVEEDLTARVSFVGHASYPYYDVYKDTFQLEGGKLPPVDVVFPSHLFDPDNENSIIRHLLYYIFIYLYRRWGNAMKKFKVSGGLAGMGDAVQEILRSLGVRVVDAFSRTILEKKISGNLSDLDIVVRRMKFSPESVVCNISDPSKSSDVKTLSVKVDFKVADASVTLHGDVWRKARVSYADYPFPLKRAAVQIQLLFTLHKTKPELNSCKIDAVIRCASGRPSKDDDFWRQIREFQYQRVLKENYNVLEIRGEANVTLQDVLPDDWLNNFLEFVFAPEKSTSWEYEVVVGWVVEKLIKQLAFTYELKVVE